MVTPDNASARALPLAPRAGSAAPARFVRTAAAFVKRDALVDFSYRLSFVLHAAHILLGVAAYFFLARFVDRAALGGAAPFPFLLVGLAANAFMSTWLVCFTEAIRSGQAAGTLKLIFSSPVSLGQFLFFSSLYPSARATIEAGVYVAGGLALGVAASLASPFGALLMLLLSSLAFAAIGIASAAFALVVKRGDPVLWIATSASWLLGGVLYPVQLLPEPLQRAAQILPITHAVDGLRAAFSGDGSVAAPAGTLLLFVIISLPSSVAAFHWALRRARARGSLGHV
jgi:ABC-type polysaccharide/polyol phosphate export permease